MALLGRYAVHGLLRIASFGDGLTMCFGDERLHFAVTGDSGAQQVIANFGQCIEQPAHDVVAQLRRQVFDGAYDLGTNVRSRCGRCGVGG
ncbi:hypothetical protein D3C84_1166450 [compost metagenome]